MAYPTAYTSTVAIPLPPEQTVRQIMGKSYDPERTLNVLKMFAGTGDVERLGGDGYAAVLDYKFTAADEALIDRLVPPGHPSTPGFSDPAYPIEGRVAGWSAPLGPDRSRLVI